MSNIIDQSHGNRLSNWKRTVRAIKAGAPHRIISTSEGADADHNCCTVVALSNVTSISFAEAQAIAASAGRRRNCGFSTVKLIAKARERGFNFDVTIGVTGTVNDAYRGETVSIARFCREHPVGRFLVRRSGHAFTVINGVVEDRFTNKPLARITHAWEFKPAIKPQYANPY